MKRWRRADEWCELALCGESDVHTVENPGPEEVTEAQRICGDCSVRVECIEWALRDKACAVFVAGIYLPDPKFKSELRAAWRLLELSLPEERDRIGDEI